MEIKKIVVGLLKSNCYLLIKDDNCLIVDPGADYSIIKEAIGSLNLVGVLITHKHYDHVGALNDLLDENKVLIYDYNNIGEDHRIKTFNFDIIENIGHSDDSVSFYFKDEKAMFCGDFIFRGSIGRTDLPTGNELAMRESLKKIKEYPSDITIYPGHGNSSTLGYEFENNPYLRNI